MMRDFSEKWHQVYTCVHVVARRKSDGKLIDKEFVETSEVLIGKMSEISI
jgi:predicted house-cleaning NTP pyrophosphatase (Maf/HAM1 superfamily)